MKALQKIWKFIKPHLPQFVGIFTAILGLSNLSVAAYTFLSKNSIYELFYRSSLAAIYLTSFVLMSRPSKVLSRIAFILSSFVYMSEFFLEFFFLVRLESSLFELHFILRFLFLALFFPVLWENLQGERLNNK